MVKSTIEIIPGLLTACALSLFLNWMVRTAARRRGWSAGPTSVRHIHEVPIPRLGGIGVFFSFTLVTAATELLRPDWFNQGEFLTLLIPASIMFGVGIYDDFRPVSAKYKLLVQSLCGTALFFWLRLTELGLSIRMFRFGDVFLFIGIIIWVVLVSNSINLIDGVDGLAGGTAVLTLVAITCIAYRAGHDEVVVLAAILIGSLLGFLRFNYNPATMFLGDGGSLFVGFMISILGIIWGDPRAIASTIGIAVAILALPLTETGVSVFRRFLSGRPLFSPDREHMHHKLLDRGLTQRQAVYLLYAVALICGLSGIAMATGGPYVFAVSFAILSLILAIGISSLGYVEFLEVGRIVKRIFEQRRVMANDVKLRKLSCLVKAAPCIAELGDEIRVSLRAVKFDRIELSLAPWLANVAPCRRRAMCMGWSHMAENRENSDVFWTMQFDLQSKSHGSLGWLRLSSKMNHGDLLFDANLLVTDLQPAIVVALEHCIAASSQCSASRLDSVTWVPAGEPALTIACEQSFADQEELRATPAEAKSTAKAND